MALFVMKKSPGSIPGMRPPRGGNCMIPASSSPHKTSITALEKESKGDLKPNNSILESRYSVMRL